MLELALTLHIFSAIWLIGYLINSAYWKKRADRSGSPETIATTSQALVRADLMFMGPGIAGLLVTGTWLGGITGWDRFQEPWLAASFILTIIIIILWLAVLLPQQRRMAAFANQSMEGIDQTDNYQKASKLWNMVAGVVTLIPLVVLVLMVFKP